MKDFDLVFEGFANESKMSSSILILYLTIPALGIGSIVGLALTLSWVCGVIRCRNLVCCL